ncbi:MAG: aldose 1-epimerase [Clostridia bacterium]|nr:aldose 1-epimerase [Clostridia bacterium]
MCEYVSIKAGKWTAEICPSFGMNTVRLKSGDKDILRAPESFDELGKSPYLYGIPLLFPANRTKGGAFVFEGEKHEFPLNEPARNNHLHGLMFNAPFRILEKTASCVLAEFENKNERYPFPFLMRIRDEVTENGYFRTLSVLNTGSSAFPYTLAFHSTFRTPDCMTVPVEKRFVCDENYIPTGEFASLTQQERMYNTGISADDYAISGFYVSAGRKAILDDIEFSVSGNFDEWVLFNAGGGKGFVSIEPQAGEVNGLNREDGAKMIAPGDTHTYTLAITENHR